MKARHKWRGVGVASVQSACVSRQLKARLDKWRGLLLSTLAQSVLKGLPIYFFLILKAHAKVIDSMEKLLPMKRTKMIATIYGVEPNDWLLKSVKASARARPWIEIDCLDKFFSILLCSKPQMGGRLDFWKILVWILPLWLFCFQIFTLSSKEENFIVVGWVNQVLSWDLGFRRNMFDREIQSWAFLGRSWTISI